MSSPAAAAEPATSANANGSSAGSRNKPADPYKDSLWNKFLLEDEKVVFTGLVTKKKSLFTHKRQLILTSLPRFVYVDPETMTYKKDIPWDDVTCSVIDDKTFTVVTPHRTYIFKALTTAARSWEDEIHKMAKIVKREQEEQARILAQSVRPQLNR